MRFLPRALTGAAGLLVACGAGSPSFPTAGVTVQAFPRVEVVTATPTLGPTDTPAATATPAPSDTAPPADTPAPAPTSTPLIRLAPPTSTVAFVLPTATRAPPGAPTPTATPPSSAGPIRPRPGQFVQFVSAVRDPARPPEGSIVTLSVEFSGSRPPFTVKHDGQPVAANPNGDGKFENAGVVYTFIHFQISRTCGGVITGTVAVTGGDGQAFSHDYFIAGSPCS